MIELIDVTKNFTLKNGLKTFELSKISMSFKDIGLIFVYGKSGSGKSTFLKLLSGQISPDTGEIKILGTNINKIKSDSKEDFLVNNIAYVPQDICLIDELNVRENLKFFLSLKGADYDEDKAKELFHKLDLSYDFLDLKVNTLSSGERQRVAIVRSILMDAKVIFLDEPVSRIYKDDGDNFKRYIKELSKDKLIIYVGHELSEFENLADEVIKFEKGKIIEHKILNNVESKVKPEISSKKPSNLWYFIKLGLSNIKFKLSKSIGLFLLMILSVSISFCSLNMFNNSWADEADELLLSECLAYGIVLNDEVNAFDKDFKSSINQEFDNNYFLTRHYEFIGEIFPTFYEAKDTVNVFEANIDLINKLPFSLEIGEMPSGNKFLISDALLFEVWESDYNEGKLVTDYIQTVNEFNIEKAFERLKSETTYVSGVFSLGNFEEIYKSANAFSYSIFRELRQYSIYYSLMVNDFDEFTKLLSDGTYKESISIPITSEETLSKIKNFKIEASYVNKVNPLVCYEQDELARRQYFDIGATIALITFLALFVIILLVYLFGVYSNHSKQYLSLKALGISKNHLFTTYISEAILGVSICIILGFTFSFLMDYLFTFMEKLMFIYPLGLTSFNWTSLAILFVIFIISILASCLTGLFKFKKEK